MAGRIFLFAFATLALTPGITRADALVRKVQSYRPDLTKAGVDPSITFGSWDASTPCAHRTPDGVLLMRYFVLSLKAGGKDAVGEILLDAQDRWHNKGWWSTLIGILTAPGGVSIDTVRLAAHKSIDRMDHWEPAKKKAFKAKVDGLKAVKDIIGLLETDPTALAGNIDDGLNSDGSRLQNLDDALRSISEDWDQKRDGQERRETFERFEQCYVDEVEARIKATRDKYTALLRSFLTELRQNEHGTYCFLQKQKDPSAILVAVDRKRDQDNPMVSLEVAKQEVASQGGHRTGGISHIAWLFRDLGAIERIVERIEKFEAYIAKNGMTKDRFEEKRRLTAELKRELPEFSASVATSLNDCRFDEISVRLGELAALRKRECFGFAEPTLRAGQGWAGHPLVDADSHEAALRKARELVDYGQNELPGALAKIQSKMQCNIGDAREEFRQLKISFELKFRDGEQTWIRGCMGDEWPFRKHRDAKRRRREELQALERDARDARSKAAGAVDACRWDEFATHLATARGHVQATGCSFPKGAYCGYGKRKNVTFCGWERLVSGLDALEGTAREKQDRVADRADRYRGELEGLLEYAASQAEAAEARTPERCTAVSEMWAAARNLAALTPPKECPDDTLPDPSKEAGRIRRQAGEAERFFGNEFEAARKATQAAIDECRLEAALEEEARLRELVPLQCNKYGVDDLLAGFARARSEKEAAAQNEHERLTTLVQTSLDQAAPLLATAKTRDAARCDALDELERIATVLEAESVEAELEACRDDYPDAAGEATRLRDEASAASQPLLAEIAALESKVAESVDRCDRKDAARLMAELDALVPLSCAADAAERSVALRTRVDGLVETAADASAALADAEAEVGRAVASCDTKTLRRLGRFDACFRSLLSREEVARLERVLEQAKAADGIDEQIARAKDQLRLGDRTYESCHLGLAEDHYAGVTDAIEKLGSRWGATCPELEDERRRAVAGLEKVKSAERQLDPLRARIDGRLALADGALNQIERRRGQALDPNRFADFARERTSAARDALDSAVAAMRSGSVPETCLLDEAERIAEVRRRLDGMDLTVVVARARPRSNRDGRRVNRPDGGMDDFFDAALDGAASGLRGAQQDRDRRADSNRGRLDRTGGAIARTADGYDPQAPNIDDFIDAVAQSRPPPPPAPPAGGGGGAGNGGLQDVYCEQPTVTVQVFDHSSQDGDIITLSLGGEALLRGFNLNGCGGSAGKGGACSATRPLPLGGGVPVTITAHNEGSSPPNTAALVVLGACTPERQSYRLKEGASAGITIYRRSSTAFR